MTFRPFALYVHVPFCSQKCPYCDFNTYAVPRVPEAEYIAALLTEVGAFARDSRFAGRELSSIFFGGGTPSLLSPEAIGRIVGTASSHFPLVAGAEVTLEANPGHPCKERYSGYRAAGVNRLSFGVQSFDAGRLTLLGREHSPDDARRAVRDAIAAGINKVSVDIIFGVPEQETGSLEVDLQAAAELPISHLSTYALSIEPGTPFFQRQERGLLALPPDERVAEMLSFIPIFLAKHGFARYEISNYAKPGHESSHNSAYWSGADYLGIGAGAHSCVTRYESGVRVSAERWSDYALPATYMQRVTESAVSWRESLDQRALQFEFFYLGLRRTCGVSLSEFERLFGGPCSEKMRGTMSDLAQEGFLEHTADVISLTESGIALSDSVFERLAGQS